MAVVDVTLQNTLITRSFLFRAAAPLENAKTQPVITIPLVNTSPDDTFLFRFTGQNETVTFSFVIFDDGVDVSNGTHTSTVSTVSEQIEYLRDTIYGANYKENWTLIQSRFYPTANPKVVITALKFDNPAGSGTFVTGNITLQRGSIGAL